MSRGWQLALLALSIFIGIVYPPVSALFKPFLLPIIFLLFLTAVLQVSFRDAAQVAFKDRAVWFVLCWQLVLLPLIFYFFLKPFLSQQLHLFAVVSMCTASITATTALCRLFNLNSALSLVVGLAGAVLMPLPLYIFLKLMTGAEVSIDLYSYGLRILVFILLPILCAWLIRKVISIEADQELQRIMPSVSLVLLVFFGLSVMDGVGVMLLNDTSRLLSYLLLAFGTSISVQLITVVALYFLGARNATTGALLCAYRNMGIVAAIAGPSLGKDFYIYLGVWQLPMYVLPLVMRRFYERDVSSTRN